MKLRNLLDQTLMNLIVLQDVYFTDVFFPPFEGQYQRSVISGYSEGDKNHKDSSPYF